MTKAIKVDWVHIGPEPYFATCKRCGEHVEKPKFPMPIKAFTKYLEYVMEQHRSCQPQEGELPE